MQTQSLKALNPVARPKEKQAQGLSPRIDSLDGKVIYVVSNTKNTAESVQQHVANLVKERHPDTDVRLFRRRLGTMINPGFEEFTTGKADAVIYGTAD